MIGRAGIPNTPSQWANRMLKPFSRIHPDGQRGLHQRQNQTLPANFLSLCRADCCPLPHRLPKLDRFWCDFPLLTIEAIISQYPTPPPPTFHYIIWVRFCNHCSPQKSSCSALLLYGTGNHRVSCWKGFQVASSINLLHCPSCLLRKIKSLCQTLLSFGSQV